MTMRGRVVVSVWKDGEDVTWYQEFREFAVSSLLDLIFSLGILPSAYRKISKYKRKDKEVRRSPVSRLRLWSAVLGVPRVAEGGLIGSEHKRIG